MAEPPSSGADHMTVRLEDDAVDTDGAAGAPGAPSSTLSGRSLVDFTKA